MANKRIPQSKTANITTDVSGNGSVTVTFENPLDHTDYTVIVTAQQDVSSGVFGILSKTTAGCTIKVTGSSVVSSTLTVGYIVSQNRF